MKNKKMYMLALALSGEFLATVFAGMIIGYYLGKLANSKELGAVLGTFLALGVWLWRLSKMVQSQSRSTHED